MFPTPKEGLKIAVVVLVVLAALKYAPASITKYVK